MDHDQDLEKEPAEGSRTTVEHALMVQRARQPFRRVVAASDFSEGADEAWVLARKVADRHGADLLLLHVLEPSPGMDTGAGAGDAEPVIRQDAEVALDKRVRQAAAQGLTATPLIRTGQPAETIVDVARAEGADLLVLGAHGLRGVPRVLVGQTAEHVLRLAPCPVLLAKR